MKKITNIKFMIICSLLLGACQSEEYEVLTEESEASFTEGSEFYNLVERSSMHDGSKDDELDESPCFSLRFPYKVTVAGLEIKIASASDLEVVLERLDEMESDEFSLQFPVTVTLSNYENVTISNLDQFREFQQNCENEIEENIAPITCVDIEFPVKIFVYNTNTQQTNSANIANKQQLYVFLQNKASNEVLNFEYPVSISYEEDSKVEINGSTEFRNALKTCIN